MFPLFSLSFILLNICTWQHLGFFPNGEIENENLKCFHFVGSLFHYYFDDVFVHWQDSKTHRTVWSQRLSVVESGQREFMSHIENEHCRCSHPHKKMQFPWVGWGYLVRSGSGLTVTEQTKTDRRCCAISTHSSVPLLPTTEIAHLQLICVLSDMT